MSFGIARANCVSARSMRACRRREAGACCMEKYSMRGGALTISKKGRFVLALAEDVLGLSESTPDGHRVALVSVGQQLEGKLYWSELATDKQVKRKHLFSTDFKCGRVRRFRWSPRDWSKGRSVRVGLCGRPGTRRLCREIRTRPY